MDLEQTKHVANRMKLILWANVSFIVTLVFAFAILRGKKLPDFTSAAHVIVPLIFLLPSALTAVGCLLLKPLHDRFPTAGMCVIAACLIGFFLPGLLGCRSIAAELNEYQNLLGEPGGELRYAQAYAAGTLTTLYAKYTMTIIFPCLVSALIGFYPLALSLTSAIQPYDGDSDFSRRWKKCAARLCVYLILAFLALGLVLMSEKLEARSFVGTSFAEVLLTRGSSVFGLIAHILVKIILIFTKAAYIRHTFFLQAAIILTQSKNSDPAGRNQGDTVD